MNQYVRLESSISSTAEEDVTRREIIISTVSTDIDACFHVWFMMCNILESTLESSR